MNFNADKAIYLQIADRLADEIVNGVYQADDRAPSVREYAALLQVNVNTMVKAYDQLARDGIIYNRRGMGYYISRDARQKILETRREQFFRQNLPETFRLMRMLDIGIDEVEKAWEKAQKTAPDNGGAPDRNDGGQQQKEL